MPAISWCKLIKVLFCLFITSQSFGEFRRDVKRYCRPRVFVPKARFLRRCNLRQPKVGHSTLLYHFIGPFFIKRRPFAFFRSRRKLTREPGGVDFLYDTVDPPETYCFFNGSFVRNRRPGCLLLIENEPYTGFGGMILRKPVTPLVSVCNVQLLHITTTSSLRDKTCKKILPLLLLPLVYSFKPFLLFGRHLLRGILKNQPGSIVFPFQ